MRWFYSFWIDRIYWQKYLFTTLIIALFWTGWWFFAFRPLTQKITQKKAIIADLTARGQQLPYVTNDCAMLQESVNTMTGYMKQVQTDYSPDSLAKQIDLVLQQAKNSSLTLHAYTPENTKNKKWYTVDKTVFQFAGSFDQIITFLRTLPSLDTLMQCGNVSITKDGPSTLMLTCTLKFYGII